MATPRRRGGVLGRLLRALRLAGEGPEQTTPWFTLQSEEPRWTVDESAAYLQSMAMVLAFMAAFLSLQRGRSDEDPLVKDDVFDEEVEA